MKHEKNNNKIKAPLLHEMKKHCLRSLLFTVLYCFLNFMFCLLIGLLAGPAVSSLREVSFQLKNRP